MRRVVACFGVASVLALGGCSSALPDHARPDAESDPARADIEAGALAYGPMLERWGTWQPDPLDGVHWCPLDDQLRPSAADFAPYATTPAAVGTASGAAGWASDDAEAWREITSRRGRWLHDETGPRPWCWVPGVALRAPEIRVRTAMRPPTGGAGGASRDGAQDTAIAVLGVVRQVTSVAADVLDVASAFTKTR